MERRRNRNGYKATTSDLENSYMRVVEVMAVSCLIVIFIMFGLSFV